MSSVAISGNASGAGVLTIAAPNTASNYTLTLPTATTTLVGTDATQTLTNKTLTSPTITGAVMSSMASSVITSSTAQASTSGTSIDFTGLPAWVKRITVMFNGVSTTGTSIIQVQFGTGSTTYTTTGYLAIAMGFGPTAGAASAITTGFGCADGNVATNTHSGNYVFTNVTGNTWTCTAQVYRNSTAIGFGAGSITLGAVLTAVRITTVNGTDTFDAGSINILYE